MRTITFRPLRRLITRTRVPMRSVRCAAVSSYMLKRSPDAVAPPCCSLPYHDALPSKVRATPSSRPPGTSRIVDGCVGRVVAQPTAPAASHKRPSAATRAWARGDTRLASLGRLQCLLPQLMSGHSVAQLLAHPEAVTLAEDVSQIGHPRERVRVLLRVAVVAAEALVGPAHQRALVLHAGRSHVLAAGAVADLALHVDEPALLGAGEVDPA